MKSDFDSNIMPLLERNPEVKYYLFYPPYSILFWINADSCQLGTFLDFKRYVIGRTRELPNVKIFDFQDADNVTFNLDNYMDVAHYSPNVDKFIIDAISRNEHLLTEDNIEERLGRLEDQVLRFSDSLDAQ
jgi:hypothetical protein